MVTVEKEAIAIDEGQIATNTITYTDAGIDNLTLTASVGTITDNGDGTWSWNYNATDGPDESQTVTITATDSDGDFTTTTFELTVNNLAPVVAVEKKAIAYHLFFPSSHLPSEADSPTASTSNFWLTEQYWLGKRFISCQVN